jgi:hypothetical protein
LSTQGLSDFFEVAFYAAEQGLVLPAAPDGIEYFLGLGSIGMADIAEADFGAVTPGEIEIVFAADAFYLGCALLLVPDGGLVGAPGLVEPLAFFPDYVEYTAHGIIPNNMVMIGDVLGIVKKNPNMGKIIPKMIYLTII